MLIDHTWASFAYTPIWMTCVGRLAFPIFAFQLVEGYYNTSNYKRYLKRLLIFAFISEIPFDLMFSGTAVNILHQNVLFTFVIGIVLVHALETGSLAKKALTLIASLILSIVLFVDYNFYGILMIIVFFLARKSAIPCVIQFIGLYLINVIFMEGQHIVINLPTTILSFPIQSFAVLSLIFIWMYNKEKGYTTKKAQLFGYIFYPLHAFILYCLACL